MRYSEYKCFRFGFDAGVAFVSIDHPPHPRLVAETFMPYETNQELPDSVRHVLPTHAQDIFREAFNHAWDEYAGDEARSFRVAWAAVKREYGKDESGRWVRTAS